MLEASMEAGENQSSGGDVQIATGKSPGCGCRRCELHSKRGLRKMGGSTEKDVQGADTIIAVKIMSLSCHSGQCQA